jgi:hypothetical protein
MGKKGHSQMTHNFREGEGEKVSWELELVSTEGIPSTQTGRSLCFSWFYVWFWWVDSLRIISSSQAIAQPKQQGKCIAFPLLIPSAVFVLR